MNSIPKLWALIKSTLIEKDGSPTIYGSIKRYAAWILLFLVFLVVISSLIPSGSLHLGDWMNMSWKHCPADMKVLDALLEAIGSYIITGQALTQITQTVQHRNTVKYGNDTPPEPK